MSESRTIYFGPPKGVYELKEFPKFVEKVYHYLKKSTPKLNLNTEVENTNTTIFHFPEAGTGLRYTLLTITNVRRCMVNLLGTRRATLDDVMSFIFEKDSK
ncbi:MAG: hypothetical protein AABX86_02555 [Nanoarchaeota archaeon]